MSDDQVVSDEHLEEEDFEVEEVEKVTHALSDLMENLESETIHSYLQTAFDGLSSLIEWEEDEEDQAEAA